MLTLRKMSEPVLKEFGLEMLHVEAKDKALALVGECGKTLLYVKGIELPKQLKGEHREYVIELLTRFLTKHGEAIHEYVSEMLEFRNLPAASKPDCINENVRVNHLSNNSSVMTADASYATNGSVQLLCKASESLQEFEAKVSRTIAQYDEVMAYLTAERERYDKENALIAKASALQSCAI